MRMRNLCTYLMRATVAPYKYPHTHRQHTATPPDPARHITPHTHTRPGCHSHSGWHTLLPPHPRTSGVRSPPDPLTRTNSPVSRTQTTSTHGAVQPRVAERTHGRPHSEVYSLPSRKPAPARAVRQPPETMRPRRQTHSRPQKPVRVPAHLPPLRGGVRGRDVPPKENFCFSAGLRILKEHMSDSSTAITAPALSNSPQ